MIDNIQYDLLIGQLDWYGYVSPGLRKVLRPLLKLVEYQSTQIIKNAGEAEKYIWFILDGYIRFVRPARGEYPARTVRFSFPGAITSEGNPFGQYQNRSDIEVLKGSLLVQVEIAAILKLSARFMELKKIADGIEDNTHTWGLIEYHCRKAKGKKAFYEEYRSDHPDLFKAYPHEQILDYLLIYDNSYL
ncbi:hypothetical protein ASE74_10050 [Pedobacter sp. Leaf216]|uniref:hypothetical protein n=1 Tax=Pedobacter sp. Leaf216 TaxID=1735684 RepID=UPI0006FCC18A|nr:hypothetical protein [Pedobacter sp. Leaf216]KQM65204.1 hypothetical protein ASE74_10050 [Pedobacter sp. Leaf216]